MEIPDEVRTVREVKKFVEDIRVMAGDYEAAHSAEDRLRAAVLTAIANGRNEDAEADLCDAVLETSNIEFDRYCA